MKIAERKLTINGVKKWIIVIAVFNEKNLNEYWVIHHIRFSSSSLIRQRWKGSWRWEVNSKVSIKWRRIFKGIDISPKLTMIFVSVRSQKWPKCPWGQIQVTIEVGS